jgi:acetylornithine deacetylase/succinyl-diaminopimelate desuccinylase-like protein
VATQISGGHAENALPQSAHAAVNCRLLPDEDPAEVERTIRQVAGDSAVVVTAARRPPPASPASPLRADVMAALERVAGAVWPGVPVIPVMETGGTDGRLLRTAGIPTYGETGMFIDEGDIRAHGRDERLRVESFYQGCEFLYRLLRELGTPAPRNARRSACPPQATPGFLDQAVGYGMSSACAAGYHSD